MEAQNAVMSSSSQQYIYINVCIYIHILVRFAVTNHDSVAYLFLKDIGEREGKYYAINVPLKDGIDDASFIRLFKIVSREPLGW